MFPFLPRVLYRQGQLLRRSISTPTSPIRTALHGPGSSVSGPLTRSGKRGVMGENEGCVYDIAHDVAMVSLHVDTPGPARPIAKEPRGMP